MGLMTMVDMSFNVQVHRWKWVYTFSRVGGVTWRDPFNGMHGSGRWSVKGSDLIVSWPSGSWDRWELPINPKSIYGRSFVKGEGEYDLWAEAINYYLRPGDVAAVGDRKFVVYDDEVRGGGSVSWMCRNPGNIRDGDKYGAYKGKKLNTKSAGAFAIFPDEEVGMRAIIAVLKGYGRISIAAAMKKYAPAGDGGNNPAAYAGALAKKVGVSADTLVTSLNDKQMESMIEEVKRVEGWIPRAGGPYSRDSNELPGEVRARLAPHLYPPTEEEMRNSSIGRAW